MNYIVRARPYRGKYSWKVILNNTVIGENVSNTKSNAVDSAKKFIAEYNARLAQLAEH